MKKRNKITLNELEKVIDIIDKKNIKQTDEYDYFRIIKENISLENAKVLYFPIHLNVNDDLGGWYASNRDLREYINNIIKSNPKATFLIEQDMVPNIEYKTAKLIIVDNIMESIDQLSNYYLEKSKEKTILVTGSVGKTSTVGLIEKVIKKNVLRIYSKRITPIILKAKIMNYLTKDIEYLVLEAGLFYRHHVKFFSDYLKPYIGIFLNVLPEHIGIDHITTMDNIVQNKLEVYRYVEYALVNKADEYLKNVEFQKDQIKYSDYKIDSKIKEVWDISKFNAKINLYVNTELSKIEYQAAYTIGEILKIPQKTILKRLDKALPVENRTQKEKIYNHEIIFDGDVSGIARFSLFTKHNYSKAVLIIRALTEDGEESEDYKLLDDFFYRFEKVYIFANVQVKNQFKSLNIQIVKNHDFIKSISQDTTIFYHYGSYYRKFSKFDLENLERNIE